MTWEKKTILVPAGVEMTRTSDGTGRIHPTALSFKAKRAVNQQGKPVTNVWLFPWLSKEYSVPQTEVTVE